MIPTGFWNKRSSEQTLSADDVQSKDGIGNLDVDSDIGEAEPEPRNFLDLIPIRNKEHVQEQWQVGFKMPRFQSKFWTWFFVHIGATETYVLRLDKMGSEIWGHIDGKKTVRAILVRLELKHSEEEELRDRLVHYLKRLKFHEFIDFKDHPDILKK